MPDQHPRPPRWGESSASPIARIVRRVSALLGVSPTGREPSASLPLRLRRGPLGAAYTESARRADHPAAGSAALVAAEGAIERGAWWEADAWAHRALWHFERADATLEAVHVARRIGDLRAAAGDPATARRYYAEAIDEARDIGAEHEQGLGALGLGRALIQLGDVTGGRRLATAAVTLLERCGAPPDEVRQAADLRGVERTVTPRSSGEEDR